MEGKGILRVYIVKTQKKKKARCLQTIDQKVTNRERATCGKV